jgi:hypothetical protein
VNWYVVVPAATGSDDKGNIIRERPATALQGWVLVVISYLSRVAAVAVGEKPPVLQHVDLILTTQSLAHVRRLLRI